MRFSVATVLATAAALAAPLASAAPVANATSIGSATVVNNCPDSIYVWSVDSTVGPQQTVASGQSYTEQFHTDPQTGIAIKITRTPNGLYDGSGQTNFAYTLAEPNVFYSLSDVYSDPFMGENLSLVPSDSSCPSIVAQNGVPPTGNPTMTCGASANLVLTAC